MSNKQVWVGWLARMLLLAVGGFFINAGYSEEQVTEWLNGTAELIVGAASVLLALAWSWYRKRGHIVKENGNGAAIVLAMLLPLFAFGCASTNPILDAAIMQRDTILPEYVAYVQSDAGLTVDDKRIRIQNADSFIHAVTLEEERVGNR